MQNLAVVQAIERAIAERGGPVAFSWVRGHVGNEFNERADELAGQAARRALSGVGCTPAAVATRCFGFRVRGLAEQDAVTIGSGGADHALVEYPSGNVAATLHHFIAGGDVGEYVKEVMALLNDGNLAPATGGAEFLRAGIRRDVNGGFPHHDGALARSSGHSGRTGYAGDDKKSENSLGEHCS